MTTDTSQRTSSWKERWKDLDVIPSILTGAVLALWIVLEEVSKLNPYFAAGFGIILFVAFIVSLMYYDYANKKFNLRAQQNQNQAQSLQTFMTEVSGASSRLGADMELRKATLLSVESMLAERLRDPNIPDEKKEVYAEILGRVQDMGRTLFRDLNTMQFELAMKARMRQQSQQPPAPTPPAPPSSEKKEEKKE